MRFQALATGEQVSPNQVDRGVRQPQRLRLKEPEARPQAAAALLCKYLQPASLLHTDKDFPRVVALVSLEDGLSKNICRGRRH